MTATAPYDARAARELVHGITLIAEAEYQPGTAGAPFPLVVESWDLTIDEETSPHATLNLTCAIPDAADLALVDVRLKQKVLLRVGYTYLDESEDLQDFAHLTVNDTTIDRPSSTLRITAYSGEAEVEEADVPVNRGWITLYNFADVNAMFTFFLPGTLNTSIPSGKQLPSAYPMSINPEEILDTIVEVRAWADSIRANVWCDQLGIWQLHNAHHLRASAAALSTKRTIDSSSVKWTRDGWANSIIITYDEDTATPRRWCELQDVGPGELVKWKHITRLTLPPGAAATAEGQVVDPAAEGLLARIKTRADRIEFTTPAHLWLRVGHTITLDLTDMVQQRVLISRIRTDSTGRQTIRTRKP